MTFVSELEPRALWHHFDKILTIPRGSGNEREMADYVLSVARSHGLESDQDDTGNLVLRKPPTDGGEAFPILILQSHLDMVNEKNSDIEHDFLKDPLLPRRDGEYLKATGTTLGSDNGIGVAAALALAGDTSFTHGPLELLFTVDEETGLTGAAQLSGDFLQGRRMINLDTEERGAIYVGCAGGGSLEITLPVQTGDVQSGSRLLRVELTGLQGGHSGVDIHLQRGNAVKLITRAMVGLSEAVRLVSLRGGNMHNAIPREAFATLVTDAEDIESTRESLTQALGTIADELSPVEPSMAWTVEVGASPEGAVLTRSATGQVLHLVNSLPHGVMSMHASIPDLVETSSNLATAGIEEGNLRMHVSTRSSSPTALADLHGRIRSTCHLAGAVLEELEGYPGWQPDLTSQLLETAKGVFVEHLGRDPEIKAIHAGLECGLIGEKYDGMDMISIGPQIEFPHSPDERVHIDSVEEFFSILKGILSVAK